MMMEQPAAGSSKGEVQVQLWKACGSRVAQNSATRACNRVVQKARSEVEVSVKKIDPKYADIYRIANQM